jgi:RNA polymerase sigma-70 factor, ECF subfamily
MEPATGALVPQPGVSLAERIANGDHAAETELVQQYSRPVFLICLTRTRDREMARDLTQDVLFAVIKSLRKSQLRESEKLAAFIQGTARNLINNFVRTKIRRAEDPLENPDAFYFDHGAEFSRVEHRSTLVKAMADLNDLDRQILELSAVDGMSAVEVAEELGISHDAVRTRKSRALKRIAEKFRQVSQI